MSVQVIAFIDSSKRIFFKLIADDGQLCLEELSHL